MKTVPTMLIIFAFSVVATRGQEISVEDFKKMPFEEREKVLEQASPEKRQELGKVHRHLYLIKSHGGEAGYRNQKEIGVSVQILTELDLRSGEIGGR